VCLLLGFQLFSEQAQERVTTTRAEYDAMAKTVLKEIERFKQEKFQDFRQFLLDFVNLQVVYNKKVRPPIALARLETWLSRFSGVCSA
jgi:Vps5 C terminal like